jgi:hypothetical protein
MLLNEEYLRNLLDTLDTLERVTRDNLILQQLAAHYIGADWQSKVEDLRSDPEIQRELAVEMAWVIEAKRRLKQSLAALQKGDAPLNMRGKLQ